jgi:hypothetical protein
MCPKKWRQYWRHNRNPVNTKDKFITNDYIVKMNVLKNRRKYSFKRLRADGAGENRSFVNEANGK